MGGRGHAEHRLPGARAGDRWRPIAVRHGSVLVAEVLNYGERTIGQIRARLFTDGDEPAGQMQPAYVPREPQSPHSPIADTLMQGPGVLPPGAGMRFTTEMHDGITAKAPPCRGPVA